MKTRTWKTVCSVVLVLLLGGAAALAAPFAKQISFTQPDGTQIELWAEGDEFHAVFETLDGYAVVFDPATKAYQYAQLSPDGNDLEPSGGEVGKADPQALGAKQHLRIKPEAVKKQARERFQRWNQATGNSVRWQELKAARRQAETAPGATTTDGAQPAAVKFTTTGRKVGLCLLVDFDDDRWTIPREDIDGFCNGDNYTGYGNNGSVKQYFFDNSNTLLTYSNIVTVYIRAPHPKSYYDDTTQGAGKQGNLLVTDVINVMTNMPGYDPHQFDSLSARADGTLDACNVYYAGGNSGVWAMGLWPDAWVLQDFGPQDLGNGKKVWRYQMSDIGTSLELGTFCHENGHMLCGFPDVYDYDYDSMGGAGVFCLMGYGSLYAYNPVQICPYLKRAAGWALPTDLSGRSTLVAMTAGFYNQLCLYGRPGVSTEYFLLENRQRTGRDANLPASGIAVWHIDELGDHNNQSLVPNTTHANYEVTLVQADNKWHFENNVNTGDAQDLYYSGNRARQYSNRFDDASAPNAHWWDGSSSGLKLSNFSASAATMTVQVGGPPPTITLTSPRNGATFKAPATISLAASVTPNGHSVTRVEFYSGNNKLLDSDLSAPYTCTWTAVPVGTYALKARAVYDSGSTVDSPAVTVKSK